MAEEFIELIDDVTGRWFAAGNSLRRQLTRNGRYILRTLSNLLVDTGLFPTHAASCVIFRRLEPDARVLVLHQLRDGFTRDATLPIVDWPTECKLSAGSPVNSQAEIATQLKISEPTLRKHFRDELDGGASRRT
jgi:hypothetical protein